MADSVEREIAELRSLFWSDRDPQGRAFVPLAEAYRRAGDLVQAVELLEDGLGRHSDFGPGHVVAGWVRRDRGEAVLAEQAFNAALVLDEENAEALRGLAELASERGDASIALDCWRRLAELEPGDAEVRARVIEAEASVERAAALAQAEPEASGDPWSAEEPERIRSTEEVALTADEVVATAADFVVDVGEPAEASEAEVRIELESAPEAEAATPLWESTPLALDVAPGAESDRAAPADVIADAAPAFTADANPDAAAPASPPAAGDDEDEPVTRTMADLYARQRLHARALRTYRRLLERAPDDAGLAERVAEMAALVAADAASATTASEPALPTLGEEPALPTTAPAAETQELGSGQGVPAAATGSAQAGGATTDAPRGAPRAPRRERSASDVESLARDWAEGPRHHGELTTPFAWPAPRAGAPAGTADPTRGAAPVQDYFRTLLSWEPGMAAVDEASSAALLDEAAGLSPSSSDEVFAEPSRTPAPGEATLLEPPSAPAFEEVMLAEPPSAPTFEEVGLPGASTSDRAAALAPVAPERTVPDVEDRRVVPIESLAPDQAVSTAALSLPAGAVVVPIESLAPSVVDIAALAPASDDFAHWLQRLQ